MAVEKITEEQQAEAENVEKADKKLNDEKLAADTAKLDQAAADKVAEINQQLSTIPDKIEEVCIDIRKKLDMLLGKVDVPTADPDSFEFDADSIIKPLQAAIVKPFMTVMQPLSLVAGKLPIIGDLGSIFTTVSNESKPKVITKEEIEALVPSVPEMPAALLKELGKIQSNVFSLCIQIPLILINLIFAMINVIYSKLKIITSVIPLGSFFPLSLIPNAINAVPKAIDFVKNAPGEIYKLIEGTIKQKLAESQALGVTQSPNANAVKNSVQNKAKEEADKAASSQNKQDSSKQQPKSDEQIKEEAEKAKEDQNAPAPSPPVESTVPEIQKNPPIPEETKSYDEVVAFWKGKFSEIKMYGFEQNQKFKQAGYSNELNYAYSIELDDPWKCLEKSVEIETLKDPVKAEFHFKEVFNNITNAKGYGYWRSVMTNCSQYELEKDSNGQYCKIQKNFNQVGSYSFCCKEYIDDFRVVVGNEKYNSWLEEIQNSDKYKNPKYKQQIDKGLAKMPALTGKYYFFGENELPTATTLVFLGRNKVF